MYQQASKSRRRWTAVLLAVLMPLWALAQQGAWPDNAIQNGNKQKRFDYFYLEAVTQQQKGNLAEAFDLFKHCYDINPESGVVNFFLATYYLEMQQDSIGLQYLKRADVADDSNGFYLEQTAQTYIKLRKPDEAIAAYEKLAQKKPRRADVLKILLSLYQYKKDYDKMISTLDRLEMVEDNPESVALAKMQVFALQGKKKEEEQVLKSLVKNHPNDPNYRVMAGNWMLQNDKPKEALKEYKKVLKDNPEHEGANMSMLDYYKMAGKTKEYELLSEQLLLSEKIPSETKQTLLRQIIANNESEGGDSTKILRLFDNMLNTDSPDADIAETKAAYMHLKGMPKDSVNNALRYALKLEPDRVAPRIQLIQAVWEEKDYDQVLQLAIPAMQYNPEELAFYYFAGFAYYLKDDQDNALLTFRKGTGQITSQSNKNLVADFYAIMGDILHQKGLDKEAFEVYDSCLQWKNDHVGCLNNYAYFLSEKGENLAKAEQMSYRTIKAEPDNATFLDTYAWILFMQQRIEEAKIYIDQALKYDENPSGVVIEHAGDIYACSGDMDKAIQFWEKAEKAGGASDLLGEKIKKRQYIKP